MLDKLRENEEPTSGYTPRIRLQVCHEELVSSRRVVGSLSSPSYKPGRQAGRKGPVVWGLDERSRHELMQSSDPVPQEDQGQLAFPCPRFPTKHSPLQRNG